jgi:hypothetical protein
MFQPGVRHILRSALITIVSPACNTLSILEASVNTTHKSVLPLDWAACNFIFGYEVSLSLEQTADSIMARFMA